MPGHSTPRRILNRLSEHREPVRLPLPEPQFPASFVGRLVDRLHMRLAGFGFSLALALFVSIFQRLRMSHNNGIVAAGRLRFVDDLQFPLHPFFVPGKVMPCRLRHAAASFLDDAMRCVRAGSLKFSDEDFDSPFDLEMNTGEGAIFWSMASFFQFAFKKKERYGVQYVDYYRQHPAGAHGAYEGLRRDPESYADQRYYNQTPLYYLATDGVIRYAKYRLIPAEEIPETGRVLGDPAEMAIEPGNQRTLPGETRDRIYLREEYRQRVARGPVRYRLQIQLHEAEKGEDPEIFNCCRPWDPETHPWHDLAEVEIDRCLDWRASCMTSYSICNTPAGLGVLPAYSVYEYNSLNYLRSHSELARKARLWACRTFGIPPRIPNNDIRNV